MMKINGHTPYYDDGQFVLYKGDCREILDGLEEGSVDMVFADPPYGLSNGGFTCHAGKRVPVNKGVWDRSKGVEADFAFHFSWIEATQRVLKDEGTMWVSGSYHSIYTCGFAIQLAGFKVLNDICWYKPNAAPNLSCRYFTASHETLIWAMKSPKAKHIFQYNEMKNGEWYKEDKLKKPNKQMRSVWSLGKPRPSEKKLGKHPTQKPLSLLKRIVTASTVEGALVLDPFNGSSTTGLMAIATGRRYIGIEKEDEYLDLSIKRYETLKAELAETEFMAEIA